jgi:hypothetical protein
MIRLRFGAPLVAIAAATVCLFAFAGEARAQYPGFCSNTCIAYESCGQSCEQCITFGLDTCEESRTTTCGEGGGQCGGCAVTNRWTETQRNKYGPQDGGATHCIGREYWYDPQNTGVNWSQYQRYITQVIEITYETTTCNGVSTTREVSRTGELGECYQFVNGVCSSGQTHEGGDIHGRECYW